MSYEDKENAVTHQMFDLRFKAADEVANKVWLNIIATPEWEEYDALDDLMRWGKWDMHAPTVTPALREVTRRHARLRIELTRIVAEAIENMVPEL